MVLSFTLHPAGGGARPTIRQCTIIKSAKAMEFLNKIELRGVVGRAEITTPGDTRKCRFSVVTEYCYRQGGEPVVETTWFHLGAWEGKNKPELEQLQPGTRVYVVGRIRTYKYTGADGTERSNWEVIANRVEILPKDDDPMQPQRN